MSYNFKDNEKLYWFSGAIIVGVLVLILGSALFPKSLFIKGRAETQGKQYIADLNKGRTEPTYEFLNCSSDDHDGDGYASCSYRKTTGDNVEPILLSCTYGWLSSGCKPYTYSNTRGVVVP